MSSIGRVFDHQSHHKAETVLASSRGEARTYNGFSTVWHRFKTKLEEEKLIAPSLTLKA
jgi:hypothetical protein